MILEPATKAFTPRLLLLGASVLSGCAIVARVPDLSGAQTLERLQGVSGWLFVLGAFLLSCSAFFSGSETAIFSLQPIDREALKDKGSKGILVERLRSHPRRLLATILLGNELVNITLTSVFAGITAQVFPRHPWANVIVVWPLLLVCGEVMPKNMALRFPRAWAMLAVRPLWVIYQAVTPVRWLVTRFVEYFILVFGVRGPARNELIREDQLRTLVDQGMAQGAIHKVEQELIHAVFDFADLPVSRLMTPRPDVVMLDLHAPWQEILDTIRDQSYSRLPVYDGDRDEVKGILMAKDLLRFLGQPPPNTRQILKIIHPPYFVPALKRADELLKEMRLRKVHMALVVDEHGSVVGLITLDDLLEELTGEVPDETDDEIDDVFTRAEDGSWMVKGNVDIDDFHEMTGLELPQGDYTTLGGFILARLGSMPEPGETVDWGGYRFEVKEVVSRRIIDVCIRLRTEPAVEDEPAEPATEETS